MHTYTHTRNDRAGESSHAVGTTVLASHEGTDPHAKGTGAEARSHRKASASEVGTGAEATDIVFVVDATTCLQTWPHCGVALFCRVETGHRQVSVSAISDLCWLFNSSLVCFL